MRSYLGNKCTNGVFVQKVLVVLPNLVLLHNLLLLHSVARFYNLASRSINNPSRCEDESAEQTQQWVFALDWPCMCTYTNCSSIPASYGNHTYVIQLLASTLPTYVNECDKETHLSNGMSIRHHLQLSGLSKVHRANQQKLSFPSEEKEYNAGRSVYEAGIMRYSSVPLHSCDYRGYSLNSRVGFHRMCLLRGKWKATQEDLHWRQWKGSTLEVNGNGGVEALVSDAHFLQ